MGFYRRFCPYGVYWALTRDSRWRLAGSISYPGAPQYFSGNRCRGRLAHGAFLGRFLVLVVNWHNSQVTIEPHIFLLNRRGSRYFGSLLLGDVCFAQAMRRSSVVFVFRLHRCVFLRGAYCMRISSLPAFLFPAASVLAILGVWRCVYHVLQL